jgi:hypothetical protein
MEFTLQASGSSVGKRTGSVCFRLKSAFYNTTHYAMQRSQMRV